MEKLKMHSPNLTQDNVARIRELFPHCITEAKGENGAVKLAVDFDQLRQELAESIVEGPQERYHLNWPGKREALLTANAPIAKTLRPCREESVDFDTTKNIFIEGDNLDALKLIQDNYLGKVRAIYIDPPYNTGGDFVYDDDFAEGFGDYLARSNQTDTENNRLVLNTEANGRFHSDWLTMIFPRLRLARNLLQDDGVIFISIDDNEVSRLRSICDEVFGSENFITCFVWQKTLTRRNDARLVSTAHEYILAYARDITKAQILRVDADEKQRATYTNRDNDPRGDWLAVPFHAPNLRPNLTYPITTPGGRVLMPPAGRCWSTTKEKFEVLLADDRIYFGKDGNGMAQRKKFWLEREEGMVPWTWWSFDYAGENREATKEIKDLFDNESPFSAPKPTKLIKRLFNLVSAKDGDLFLDFFGGSGTTAQAVLQLNSEDGINRKYIVVQIAEACSEETVAYKNGYSNIAAITKERLRRCGKEVLRGDNHKYSKNDVGFRALRIDTSNLADVFYSPDALDKENLDLFVDNIKPDRTPEDLLFQVMLDWGVDLALPIAKQAIQGKDVFFVDGNALAACFDASGSIDEVFVKELAKHVPLRVVFRDAGFKNSTVKINVEQIFKLLSPATDVKCI
ncbi:site-specific DNA-methyltransferase [Pseudomonas sp. MF6772]|uniref:site-specific DNA-methyltransferase n=1 Tax=Pseudomonas TaxID=286 RepID=UPI0004753866|nr:MULTISPECIES: site-specific DNA-methyltransferase [Pseudomonas]MBJ2270268.1 site-specific DNA-methyltransferase [Pseudomonas sp. MF6772]NMX81903.1 site-specific DNA-methyltransferase [Pseudomonas sp. WS 5503]